MMYAEAILASLLLKNMKKPWLEGLEECEQLEKKRK